MKLYPFNEHKHAHDIEFMINHYRNTISDMRRGNIPWNDTKYDQLCDRLFALNDLLSTILIKSCHYGCNGRNGRIAYLTEEQLSLAKEAVIWAAETRYKN